MFDREDLDGIGINYFEQYMKRESVKVHPPYTIIDLRE